MKSTIAILLTAICLTLFAPALPQTAQCVAATTSQQSKSSSKSKSKSASKSKSKSSKSSKNTKKTNTKKSSKKNSKKKTTNQGKKKESSADLKRQQQEAQQEVARTRQQIKQNNAAVKKGLNELGKLEGDIEIGKKRVSDAGAKVDLLDKQIQSLQSQISTEEGQLESLRSEYLKAIKKMRTKRKETSTLAFIFSSESFNQALRRMRYLRQFSDWRERRTAEISQRVATLKKQSEQLTQTKSMHDHALAESLKAQNQLQAQYQKQNGIVAELKKNGEALNAHLSQKQAEVNKLNNRVAALIAEEQRKAAEAERKAAIEAERKAAEQKKQREAELLAENEAKEKAAANKDADKKASKKNESKKKDSKKKESDVSYAEARKRKPRSDSQKSSSASSSTSSSNSSTVASHSGGNFESMKGSLPRPVAGPFHVTSRFGRHALPDLPNVTYDNPGIDAEVNAGASALAVYGGKVSGVYMIEGYSTVVIVNHGGYYTVYGNIASAGVKVGDVVKQGQTLGKLATDEDDPSHSTIHFEVWKSRDKMDPQSWIK